MRMAWDEATKLGESDVALNAVEEIGKRFEIDVLAIKAKTLQSVGKTTSGWASSRKQELAEKIRRLVGFEGELVWDETKPDGQPRRSLDTRRAAAEFGFRTEMEFDEGLRRTIEWWQSVRV